MATDGTSGTIAIHKEFFFPLVSGNKHENLSNFMRQVKTFTGLVEIAKVKASEKTPRSQLPEFKRQAVVKRLFHSGLKMPGNMNFTLLSGETGCSKVLVTM